MKNELFERELQNTSINGVTLAEYVKENYLPVSVLDKIRAEIEEQKKDRCFDDMFEYITGLDDALYIIDKYKAESEE